MKGCFDVTATLPFKQKTKIENRIYILINSDDNDISTYFYDC